MAFTVILSPVPLRSPEFSASRNNSPKPIIYFTRKRPVLSLAATQEQPTATPEIQLEFIGPKPEGDGMYPVDRAAAVSGEKLLRTIMSDNKLELYGTPKNKHNSSLSDLERDMGLIPDILGQLCALSVEGGKVMNCGGGGSCGTCIVEVVEGQELLNERTNTELKYLKKKPETWRLACQTIVGNKENSGKVVIQRLPQWKK